MNDDGEFRLVPPNPAKKVKKRTPMMEQFMEAKAQEPDALLFFRMGDFYELFYEDAIVAAEILEIALTTRDRKSDNPVPMCGIPYHAMDNYIGKLITAGHRVAICDQVEDPKLAKGLVKREITRIMTPGTLVEDNLLNASENNYLCAIAEKQQQVAAAFLDSSTGEFKLVTHSGKNRWLKIADDLVQQRPMEIIYPSELPLPAEITESVTALIHGQDDWWFGPDFAEKEL